MSDLLLRLDYIKCDSVLFSIRILSTGYGKNLDFILLIFIYKIFRLYWIACTRMAFLSFSTYHITMQKNQHYDDEKSFSFMSLLSIASLSLVNAKKNLPPATRILYVNVIPVDENQFRCNFGAFLGKLNICHGTLNDFYLTLGF